MLLAAFSLGGVLLAVIWFVLGTRQLQALELNRRFLRHLEAEAWQQGIPLGTQTLEGFVAHPNRDIDTPDRFGVSLADEDGIGVVRFRHEEFPSDDGAWRYRRWVAQAGVGPLETRLSLGFGAVWLVAAVVSAVGLFRNEEAWAASGLILCILGALALLFGLLLRRRCWKRLLCVAALLALVDGLAFLCASLTFTWQAPVQPFYSTHDTR